MLYLRQQCQNYYEHFKFMHIFIYHMNLPCTEELCAFLCVVQLLFAQSGNDLLRPWAENSFFLPSATEICLPEIYLDISAIQPRVFSKQSMCSLCYCNMDPCFMMLSIYTVYESRSTRSIHGFLSHWYCKVPLNNQVSVSTSACNKLLVTNPKGGQKGVAQWSQLTGKQTRLPQNSNSSYLHLNSPIKCQQFCASAQREGEGQIRTTDVPYMHHR